MTFNHKLINKILDAIFPLPEKFGILLYENKDTEPINYTFLKNAVANADPAASIYFGMSKMAIVSPNLGNIVIKIPFNGCFFMTKEEGFEWCPFEWASELDSSDYCFAEYQKYKKLKTYGLDCFVAKTWYYKKIRGVRVFLQEFVTPEEDLCFNLIKKPSKKSQTLANKWYDEGKFELDPDWIANCIDRYGKSKVKRFLYYCDNIDPDILEDLHDGNYGYRKNDTPCILDYSNYAS